MPREEAGLAYPCRARMAFEMSNTTSFGQISSPSPPAIGGVGYGIGVSVGILVLITTLMLASYFCTRGAGPQQPPARAAGQAAGDVEAGGLDEATLAAYPKLMYSQVARRARFRGGGDESTASSCCSICLADYKDPDVLRRLPECGHLFHLRCVDPWLRLHPTCPVCRTSPVPSPVPTPLSELVPLARVESR